MTHVTNHATCRSNRTRGVGELIDDEPRDKRATCRGTRTRGVGEVVDDEPARGEVVDDESHDKPRGVPKQPDVWRR
jgi:hypothetical protein